MASLPEAARVIRGVIFAQHVADGVADVGFIVGDENVHVADDGVFRSLDVAGAEDGVGALGGLAKALADNADIFQDLLQSSAKIVVADVFLHQGVGVGGDVVERVRRLRCKHRRRPCGWC